MNSKKVRSFLSISDKINDEVFMVVFSIFFIWEKMMSSEFPHFKKRLSFEGLLSPLGGVCLLKECYLSGFYHFEG